MRFDEKPKRRSFHLKKSRAGISRDSGISRPKKISKTEKFKEEPELEEPLVFKREKPMKLPEDYDEDETFRESLTSAIKNHVPLIASGVALLIAIGFFTGTIQRIFTHEESQENTAAAATENAFLAKPKTVFTQGKFNLSTENTDAGIDIICDTITDDQGNEKKTCHAKTEEDKKREQEEKEREEQEKKAKEEREKEEKEDQEAKEKKAKSSSSSSSDSKTEKETTNKTEGPVRATGITSISGCPAEAAAGNLIVLKATVLPFNAENQNIIWSTTSSASVVYDGTGNTATVSVRAGEKVIVTAMTVDGGYTEHCVFPIVAELTE